MKKTYLFCTKPHFFLCEIPPIILLIVSIFYNNYSEGLLKLFPLIIFSCAAIVFIFLYFFRMIIISFEEIKCIGAFSSKDNAIINKNKTLILTLHRRNKMTVRLFGSGGTPGFDWAQGEDYQPINIDLFRERAIGNLSSVKRILSYFEIPLEDIRALEAANEYEKEYENFVLSKSTAEDEITVSISFTNTI